MSNKCCTPLCKGTAQYDAISWKDVTMLGISCYRKNYDCIRHVLEGLKTDVSGHAETCLPIICSNLGCFVFPLIFLGGCPNHEKINETCPLGWDPENKKTLVQDKYGWYKPTAQRQQKTVLSKDIEAQNAKTIEQTKKTKKTKKTIFQRSWNRGPPQRVCKYCFYCFFFGFFNVFLFFL